MITQLLIKKYTHGDFIEQMNEVAFNLSEISGTIIKMRDSLKVGEIKEGRVAMGEALATASVLLEIIKCKYSFMPDEYKLLENAVVQTMMPKEEDFSSMEF